MPAADVICHRCSRSGHYGAQYFSRNSTAPEVNLDLAVLDKVNSNAMSAWTMTRQFC